MLALASPIALSAVLTAFMNIWNIWVMAVSLVESDGVGLSPMLSAKSWIFSTCFCISLPIASAKAISQPPSPPFALPLASPTPLSVTWYRSEEHTSELPSLMRLSYAVFCLKKKKNTTYHNTQHVNIDNTYDTQTTHII